MSPSLDELSEAVGRELGALGAWENAVFCAACAERLIPLYQQFCSEEGWDRTAELEGILNAVWAAVSNASVTGALDGKIAKLESLVPHADDFDSEFVTAAQDSVICTDLAVRSLLGLQLGGALSAQYALEGLSSTEAARRTGFSSSGSTVEDREMEAEVIASRVVQSELECQRQDATALTSPGDCSDLAERIRTRARLNAHK